RQWHGMGYDPGRQRVVLFGGQAATSTNYLNDTWEWDGINWTQVVTAHSPPPAPSSSGSQASLVFDRTRNRLTSFSADPAGAVWESDGVDWSVVVPASAPSVRYMSAVVDDPPRGNLVLFGGLSSNASLGDTWTWDGSHWALAASASSPS